MRIALIQPPIEDFYSTPQRTYPLGLTYLAAAINHLPVKIDLLDFITDHGRHTIPIPKSFEILKSYLPYDHSPISAFHSFYHWGISWHDMESFFKNNPYDLFAISSNFYTYSEEVIQTAKIIKSLYPNSCILVGGQNVGPMHSLFTSCPEIDFLIQGEAEHSFHDVVHAFLKKDDLSNIPGFWNKNTGQWNPVKFNDSFAFLPQASILPANKYKIAGKPAIMISTSRGCPMGCTFCSVSQTFGKYLRLKSTENILKEVHEAYNRGIRVFDIEDDNFTFNKAHCLQFLHALSTDFPKDIQLYAMNGLSAEHLDKELLLYLQKAGLTLLNLSIATSSESQLHRLHRNISIEHFKNIANYASSLGMKVMGHFIAGLPKQSLTEIIETMLVLSELPLILGISPFYYIPGMNMDVPNTPKHCKEARLTRFWPADNQLNELDLITLFRLSRWINYLKNRMLSAQISVLNFQNIASNFKDDPYLVSLILDQNILGLDSKNTFYEHNISENVVLEFLDLFKNCQIRI
jgi:radical SAM superfamily enzyme YgiQ (UPF0313 family)